MKEHGSERTIVLALVPSLDSSFLQTLNLCLYVFYFTVGDTNG